MNEDFRRIAVFYHYFEADAVYRDNLVFFVSTATRDADVFLVAADSKLPELPDLPHLQIIPTRNLNLDWGGYAQAITQIPSLDQYDAFVFINSSVRGPFRPESAKGSWFSSLTDLLQGDVHLAGSSINHLPLGSRYAERYRRLFDHPGPLSHVQTPAYAMTARAFQYLQSIHFWEYEVEYPKEEVIFRYEIRLSQELMAQGWNLATLLGGDRGMDYREDHSDPNFAAIGGDALRPRGYFGRTPGPLELLFVKTNRSLMDAETLSSWTYTSLLAVKDPKILTWLPYQDLKQRCEKDLRDRATVRENQRIGAFRRWTRWLKRKAGRL